MLRMGWFLSLLIFLLLPLISRAELDNERWIVNLKPGKLADFQAAIQEKIAKLKAILPESVLSTLANRDFKILKSIKAETINLVEFPEIPTSNEDDENEEEDADANINVNEIPTSIADADASENQTVNQGKTITLPLFKNFNFTRFASRLSSVLLIEKDEEYKMDGTYVQDVGPDLWHLDTLSKQDFISDNGKFEYFYMGTGVDVYVFDTGILTPHKDFGGRAKFYKSYTGSSCSDCNGHGTHVAGSIGGTTYGVAKNATLWSVQVLQDSGTTNTYTIIEAVYDVSDNLQKTSIACMSLGGPSSSTLKAALSVARQKGLIIATSAGNYELDACGFSPADSPDVITVAAHDKRGYRASFSNFGECVDVYAPGVSIKSTYIGDSYASTSILSGTSMSAPLVAGMLAALLEENSYLTFPLAQRIVTGQTKTVFYETDAPAAYSKIHAAPCEFNCESVVIEMSANQASSLQPEVGIMPEINGNVSAWLYHQGNADPSSLTFSLVYFDDGIETAIVKSSSTEFPLTLTGLTRTNITYFLKVVRTINLGANDSFILFYETPSKCIASINCSANGNCNDDGTCSCFAGFYGSECSGDTVNFLFVYHIALGSIIYVAYTVVLFFKQRTFPTRNRVEEYEPLLSTKSTG